MSLDQVLWNSGSPSTCYTFTTSVALVISYSGGIHSFLSGVYSVVLLFYNSKDGTEGNGETESPSKRVDVDTMVYVY